MTTRIDEELPSNVIAVDFRAPRRGSAEGGDDPGPRGLWPEAIATLDEHGGRWDPGEADTDPYGLWSLAGAVAAPQHCELVYGEVPGGRVVVADAALVGAITAHRDELDQSDVEWEDAVPWLDQQMSRLLPADLLDRYTTKLSTALDGDVPQIVATDATPLVEALRARGFSCRRDDNAVRGACGYSWSSPTAPV